jgi:secretion/DNA translocation related TadE-like protein
VSTALGGRGDRGSASLLVLVHLVVLVLLASAFAAVTGLVAAHRQAQAAADLAALAGARAATRGEAACPAAAEVAEANGGRLRACRPGGMDVLVDVTVPAPSWLVAVPDPVGTARAGPR